MLLPHWKLLFSLAIVAKFVVTITPKHFVIQMAWDFLDLSWYLKYIIELDSYVYIYTYYRLKI